ncbi:MAG: lytic transglycosylase domain-containing protein [Prevotellaceae bacterium]|nr:lytic transglycosylase domain-containing protein [Prevotellaceae bacterium]
MQAIKPRLTKHHMFIICILTIFAGGVEGQTFSSSNGLPPEPNVVVDQQYLPQNVRTPVLPRSLDFAGEKIPLENFDTRESLERELMVNMFWHSQTIFIIKQTSRFFPTIEAILKKNNIPDDFKYLCAAESGLQQVVSPAKAVGFWQLMPATAKELGLEVNDEVDERYHIEKSTWAACRYLQRSYDLFGSWTLAAAAYNMGEKGLTQQIARQKAISYHDLRLNDETARYLFRILAFKLIISNPQQYGFYIPLTEMYPPYRYREVAVSTSVASWADFAIQYNTNYKILKILNTWLRDAALTNKNKRTYYIKVPEAGFRENAYSSRQTKHR